MAGLVRVEGSWPGPVDLSLGWFRARARPWNDQVSDPMIRLQRGGADFLTSVVSRLAELGQETFYSPALFSTATRVWRKADFTTYTSLEIMERALTADDDHESPEISVTTEPVWDGVLDIDGAAFEGFWRMSRAGLNDAFTVNKNSVLMLVGEPNPVGYALVGLQWGVAYLHRIAVEPASSRRGIGQDILRHAFTWSYRAGARSMVLNVRPENTRAVRFYERQGFARTMSHLSVLQLTLN